jgi:hypothetical protein
MEPYMYYIIYVDAHIHAHVYMHTMDYFLSGKKNKIMSFLGKWVELDIVLSETSQIQQDKYHMLSVICGS